MNPDNGEIRPLEQVPAGEEWIPLTNREARRLEGIVRADRPSALAQMRGLDTIRPNKKKAAKKGRR